MGSRIRSTWKMPSWYPITAFYITHIHFDDKKYLHVAPLSQQDPLLHSLMPVATRGPLLLEALWLEMGTQILRPQMLFCLLM